VTAVDVSRLVAIDVHTHAEVSAAGHGSLADELESASTAYFRMEQARRPTLAEMAAYYRERRMACVVFPVDSESATGVPAVPNEDVLDAAAAHPDVLIPFASLDPAKGRMAARRVPELVDLGVKGFKFHPSVQGFYPNDRAAYPLYEAIETAGVPALFHTGQTGIGAATPGGGGIRLKFSNPMYVDDVAADFPGMPIVLAHPSFPWQDEALAVATHKAQVHIDLSGWSPRYFPPQLVRYANSLLQDKVLFGSDYPMLTPDRWLADFEKLDIKPEVRQKILVTNAARLLGLG
jgi:hypothetical protein